MTIRSERRILTGDRPTGPLHLGHWVGTLANRVRLQHDYRTFVLVADLHMLTTHAGRHTDVERNIREDVLGNLAVGVDPGVVTIFLQSRVPEVAELYLLLSMLVTTARVKRIPTLKDKLGELGVQQPTLGLTGYPVLQAADILLFGGTLVPVGRDQVSHIELARELARDLNTMRPDTVPVPEPLVPDVGLLPGTDGSPKMGRSLGNAINLFDPPSIVRKKVRSMYTDPTRLRASDPGHVTGNPVFTYLDTFSTDPGETADLKVRYEEGRVGDVEVKSRLEEHLQRFLDPIRIRREELLASDPAIVEDVLSSGTLAARTIAAGQLEAVRDAFKISYFPGVGRG